MHMNTGDVEKTFHSLEQWLTPVILLSSVRSKYKFYLYFLIH